MFRNHFKITLRSLGKNKVTSLINLFGLTAGFTSCFLIGLLVQHEFSFDTFQEKKDRIARVIMEYSFDGSPESKKGNFTSTKVAPVFVRTFPEVESAVRMTDRDVIIRNKDNIVTESNFMFADSTFFQIFSYTLLQGNPRHALDGPRKVILTESTARKYFGNESAMGKILVAGSEEVPYEVTGVVKDYPANSQIRFDFLASFSSLGVNQEESYFDANYTTYLLLRDKSALGPLQGKITPFMKKEMAGSGASVNYSLEPFTRVHLYSPYNAFVPNTSAAYLYILSAVAVLILVIVCFTYVNLSTARSVERAREVGIRKVVGAARRQLFWQFIGESLMLTTASVALSINAAVILLPSFNALTEKHLTIGALFTPVWMIGSIPFILIVSLMAGSYPAIMLSGFQPVKTLKGIFKNSNAGKQIQQSLIVFQFAITVFLIVSTLVIQRQLHFIQHKKLGYDREHVLVLPMNEKILHTLSVIKKELTSDPAILSVSRCASTPVTIAGGYSIRSAVMPENEQISVYGNPVDEDYIRTTGLEIIAGEDFSEQDIRDVTSDNAEERVYHFILNESASSTMGWTPEEAIGKKLSMGGRAGVVKGVIKDFHFESMHNTIKPLVLFTELRAHGHLLVKVNGSDLAKVISFTTAKWKQLVPSVPFEYRFLDDDYTAMYKSELQLGKAMNLFAALAILLACIGLFGLSSCVVQQRTKEIGVRKILGASIMNVAGMLSMNFIRPVLIAILIATPIAYSLMSNWLEDFAYRIELRWWFFAMAGLLAMTIALLTVSFQSIKAAITNPVNSLRSE